MNRNTPPGRSDGGAKPAMYVVGGQNRLAAALLRDQEGFQKGLILAVSEDGAYAGTAAEYRSPPDVRSDGNAAILFKSASLIGGRLYACTQTEILIYAVPGFSLEKYISLPMFNDLHHVTPSPRGSLFVTCTGLDAVLEISEAGEMLREWELSGQDLWARFDKQTDYRKIASTKPHAAHPNFVFLRGDEVWVTRAIQRDAVRLLPSEGRIAIDVERPHDGIVIDQMAYFTTVDGHVIRADLAREKVDAVFDLATLFSTDYPLGWCRGLKVLDHDRVIVGFSRLRTTRIQDNVRWAVRRLKGAWGAQSMYWDTFPTRICGVDLARGQILWETNLEPYGMNAVFSIL